MDESHKQQRPPGVSAESFADFEAAARRPLAQRLRYAFIKTYKPVLDDATYRSFETMAEYREWCEKNLPSWLGYGRAKLPTQGNEQDPKSEIANPKC